MGGRDQQRRHQDRLTPAADPGRDQGSCHRAICHRRRYRGHVHRSRCLRPRYRCGRLHQEPDHLWSTGRGRVRLHPQGCARRARCELREAWHHARHQRAAAAQWRQDRAADHQGLSRRPGDRARQPARSRSTCGSAATQPLVPRALRFEVDGAHRQRRARCNAAGDERLYGDRGEACGRAKVEAVAISFLNAYLDPAHERGRRRRRCAGCCRTSSSPPAPS